LLKKRGAIDKNVDRAFFFFQAQFHLAADDMAKAVFTTKSVASAYDDLPECRYHFPKTYLNQVRNALGDWIVYYEPRRATAEVSSKGGAQAYFAIARVVKIHEDPIRASHFYANVDNYLPFSRSVPFKEGLRYYESLLEKSDGSTNKGAFGRAVRALPDAEFDRIWQAGFGHIIGLEQRIRAEPDVPEDPLQPIPGFAEDTTAFVYDGPVEQDRRIVEQLVSRPFRDRAFATAVKDAYGDTCAMRSEERRVGKECRRLCRSRWSPYH
jgi:putative restriction endonuclease